MMAELECEEHRDRHLSGGAPEPVNLRDTPALARGYQVGVWMPVWGARRIPHCLLGPAGCREWGLLREVVFPEKNQVSAKMRICWECFVKTLEGVGEVLGRKVGRDGRNP